MTHSIDRVITIDGPAGSGKSTVSRILARKLNRLYLDTGALYRAVALSAKRAGLTPSDSERLGTLCAELDLNFVYNAEQPRLFLGDEDITEAIRSPEMDLLSSTISAVREVRDSMTELQRRMAKKAPVVAEGRDMGTVVFPESRTKFYLTASVEIRAERRYNERLERGEKVTLAVVEEELKKRDEQDQTRAIAPLRPAKDALIIDTTDLGPEQVVEKIRKHLE
jgi:cytidylate kinase